MPFLRQSGRRTILRRNRYREGPACCSLWVIRRSKRGRRTTRRWRRMRRSPRRLISRELLMEICCPSFNKACFTLDPANSLRTGDIVHSRYFEISQYHIKPGHRKEWMELVKMYHDGFEKAVPNANWA